MLTRRSILALAALLCVSGVLAAQAADTAATMKAVRVHEFGGVDKLKFEDAPRPVAGAGELLVRVRAAGVNPVDWKIRQGMFKGMGIAMPMIPGYDVSGVVESVGSGVQGFAPGDEVFAYLSLQRGGGYAQYAIVAAKEAAKKPAALEHEKAAAVPLAALTAWQALIDNAKLQKGQTVLIHGAAGGVGHFAVQIAKASGAKVIATASERNIDFVKGLGAERVIDYKKEKFEDVAGQVDVVLDPIGGETQARSFNNLKRGGFLVSIVEPPSPEKLKEAGARGTIMLVSPDGAQLAQLAAMIEEGALKPEVSEVLPLREAAKAHEISESGRTARGKIVLKVD